MTPVWLSLSVGVAATLASLPAAVAAAWALERARWPGRGLFHAAVLLPLALPPVATGYILLWLLSPRGPAGRALEAVGLPVAFHWLGAVVAAAVVGFPLFVMSVAQAMRAVDPRLEIAARSLGLGRWGTFRRVTLPLSWPGILSGAVLSFARGLGEFGATMVLAGRIEGVTETIPIAVYAALQRPGAEATAWGLVGAAALLAAACVAASRRLETRWRARMELER